MSIYVDFMFNHALSLHLRPQRKEKRKEVVKHFSIIRDGSLDKRDSDTKSDFLLFRSCQKRCCASRMIFLSFLIEWVLNEIFRVT